MSARSLTGALLLLVAAACSTSGDLGAACTAASDCDDGDPCSADACTEGHCARTRVPDGPGDLPQTSGDCHHSVCKDGALVLEDDPSDTVSDDDECTADSCINGVPAHLPGKDGVICHLPGGAGVCTGGLCQFPVCLPELPCNDGNPCTADGCSPDGTECLAVPLDDLPTPLREQTIGDCVENRCVKGQDTKVIDDADLPDDGNPCTVDVCDAGKPKHPFAPAGMPCGEAMSCDAAGQCGS